MDHLFPLRVLKELSRTFTYIGHLLHAIFTFIYEFLVFYIALLVIFTYQSQHFYISSPNKRYNLILYPFLVIRISNKTFFKYLFFIADTLSNYWYI